MLTMTIATFGEAVGYGGRIMMHKNPWDRNGFKTQICCLVLAPSFLAAGIYRKSLTMSQPEQRERCGVI